jgi:hypothetical protein
LTRTKIRLSENQKGKNMLIDLIVKTAEFLWSCIKSPVGEELLSEWEQYLSTGGFTTPADTASSGQQAQTASSRRGVPSDTGAQ